MNVISSLLGAVGLVICIVGILPLLGWLNWISLLIAILGTILGILARQKTGLGLNILVLVISMFRLMIGGGIV